MIVELVDLGVPVLNTVATLGFVGAKFRFLAASRLAALVVLPVNAYLLKQVKGIVAILTALLLWQGWFDA